VAQRAVPLLALSDPGAALLQQLRVRFARIGHR
jgi:hypothetical protein